MTKRSGTNMDSGRRFLNWSINWIINSGLHFTLDLLQVSRKNSHKRQSFGIGIKSR